MKFFFTAFIGALIITASYSQQTTVTALPNYFDTYAKEYNVPAGLLKAIAFVESRFNNEIPSAQNAGGNHGIMGLRDDKWFGHSLIEGAKLINAIPDDVEVNESLNIQAAAALLSSFADSLNIDRSNINNWRPVVEKYSGIPQAYVKPFFSYEVFDALSKGEALNGVRIPMDNEISMSQFPSYVKPDGKILKIDTAYSTDYPPAEWIPSPNYTKGSIQQLFCVVHVTQETFANTISLFLNPNYQASSHYLIRSSDGKVVQFVSEHDKAWHAVCWNSYALGVEHEGWVDQPQWFTEAMYESSAALFRHFVETYGIPVDSARIIGHYQWSKSWWVNWINNVWNPAHPSATLDPTCNNHTDPGPYWNWTHYFDLIKQGAANPKITDYTPGSSDTTWSSSSVIINFDQAMDTAAAKAAFHISPSVSGNLKWTNFGKTLTFIPNSLLPAGTKFTVTLDSSAVSILNLSTDTVFSFNFYTYPAVPVSIINTYPVNSQNNISTTVKVIAEFNTPLVNSGFNGYVLVQDSAGNSIGVKGLFYYTSNNNGYLSFSTNTLNYNSTYKVTIKSGIQNEYTSTLGNDYTFSFKTGSNNYMPGTIIEGFTSSGNWSQPSSNSGSVGIDTTKTRFVVLYGNSPGGSYLGKLTYKFTQSSGGICNVMNTKTPSIGSTERDYFGFWVYSDLSNNYVGGLFTVNGTQKEATVLDSLNWTGWKFIKIPFRKIIGQQPNGEILFDGLYIKQSSIGTDSNQVSFAGVQYIDTLSTAVKNGNGNSISDKFELAQNYPNPFNPSTQIKFSIPKSGFVKIEVYNLLGQEVSNLVNREMEAGDHSINFDAQNLSSGVYIYTITVNNLISSKKMILLK